MTRLLVCGGRGYRNQALVWKTLDRLHGERQFTHFIHGGASGADAIARDWAATKPGLTRYICRADWDAHGLAAGPIRNARMLEWKPDVVVAFPTPGEKNRGTADMVQKAKEAGIEVIMIEVR